jgi:prophage regulatory protein
MCNSIAGDANMPQAILRLPAVKARTGLSRSTIYLRIAEGTFPRPIALGARAVGWLESEIDDWLRQRVEESRKDGSSANPVGGLRHG